jgi:hypothetical protein
MTLAGVVDVGRSWVDVERHLGTLIPISGTRGKRAGALGLKGTLDLDSHVTGHGRTQIWLTLIGSVSAEALVTSLFGVQREGCRCGLSRPQRRHLFSWNANADGAKVPLRGPRSGDPRHTYGR